MSVMKIFTQGEMNVTCYCLKKNPILFEVEGILLPTVYTLWELPFLSISFRTYTHVFSILAGGADLMLPGVLIPKNGLPEFSAKCQCYVTLQGNGAAVAVGLTSCSKQDIINDGVQGKRVNIFHCFNDHLWAIGDKSHPPVIPEVADEACDQENLLENGGTYDLEHEASNNGLVDTNEVLIPDNKTIDDISNELQPELSSVLNEQEETGSSLSEPDLTPQEKMDLLLENCFYQALINAKKVELPILVSSFVSQYVHPVCPDGQRIDVKKSTYKKMSKFLAEMQLRDLVEVKELSKGVESIAKISIENEEIRRYKSSEFAQMIKEMKEIKLANEKAISDEKNASIAIRELFAVSAKTVPFFKVYEISKSTALTSADVRKHLTKYAKDNELINPQDKKKVNLDPLLTDVLYGRSAHENSLTWDGMINKMLENMNVCHEVTLPGQKPIIKKGKMEFIDVSVEQRMGNKKVTIVKNLESFGIDPKLFAQSLQQAAASSTAVNSALGKNNVGQLVLVQGVQTKHIKALLETRNIPKKFIKGLDSAAKDKKRR